MTSETELYLVAAVGGRVVEILGPYPRDDVIDSNRGIRWLRESHKNGDVYCARTSDRYSAREMVERLLAKRRP